MKKVLLTILAIVLILGALGAASMTGYRYGYTQGLSVNSDGTVPALPGFGYGPQRMPMHGYGFDRGFGHGYGMNGGMMGFGFFSPFRLLLQVAFWALVIWAVYMLVARSGWRLTRTAATPSEPAAPSKETTE